MNDNARKGARLALQLALAAVAARGWAEPVMRFDTLDQKGKTPASLIGSVREATKDLELPATDVVREVVAPAVDAATKLVVKPPVLKQEPTFWGRDGRWCPDGQVYRGGPCDYDDPYYQDPYRDPWGGPWRRDPWDDPNWDRRDRYRRDPYYRDPYYRDRYPYRRYPDRGPTRDPWRDPPTRRRRW